MDKIKQAWMLLQIAEKALGFPNLIHLHTQAVDILKDHSLKEEEPSADVPQPEPLDPTAGTFGDPDHA